MQRRQREPSSGEPCTPIALPETISTIDKGSPMHGSVQPHPGSLV